MIRGGVTDEVAVSLGADVYFAELNPGFYDKGFYVVPIAAARWNLYLGDHWSIFPEGGLAFHVDTNGDGWKRRSPQFLRHRISLSVPGSTSRPATRCWCEPAPRAGSRSA